MRSSIQSCYKLNYFENIVGSYKCHCHSKYRKDPKNNAKCICDEGYTFDILTETCTEESKKCIQKCSHACGPEGFCICPKGYILNTDNNVECIKKKKRKKHKKKKILGCSAYNATAGIQLIYTKDLNLDTNLYPRGTNVKGKCLSGYKSSGKLRKRCKKDGTWKGHDLKCTLITCPIITNLEPDVIVEPESCGLENSLVKQKCQYSCKDPKHFKLIGSKTARCKKNGTWKQKGGSPMCIEKKKKKRKNKKNRKKNKQLGHPLSTIAVPPTYDVIRTTTTTTQGADIGANINIPCRLDNSNPSSKAF